jgi:hypothetical protein
VPDVVADQRHQHARRAFSCRVRGAVVIPPPRILLAKPRESPIIGPPVSRPLAYERYIDITLV